MPSVSDGLRQQLAKLREVAGDVGAFISRPEGSYGLAGAGAGFVVSVREGVLQLVHTRSLDLSIFGAQPLETVVLTAASAVMMGTMGRFISQRSDPDLANPRYRANHPLLRTVVMPLTGATSTLVGAFCQAHATPGLAAQMDLVGVPFVAIIVMEDLLSLL